MMSNPYPFEVNNMASSKYWYSSIYEQNNYGFYLEKKNNKFYLGFKYKTKKDVCVKISYDSFMVLKKEWR